MKKFIIFLLSLQICACTAFGFSACGKTICGGGVQPSKEIRIVHEINSNTNLDFEFLQDVADVDFSDYLHFPGFGVESYVNAKYGDQISFEAILYGEVVGVYYSVTAYPDYADGGEYITLIICSDPEVTFFDSCTINDAYALFDYLESMGFEVSRNDEDYRVEAENIIVTWTVGKGIYFRYAVSNRTGIVF